MSKNNLPIANTQQNPLLEKQLQQLKDIHLPAEINRFELAAGWWGLIAIIFLLGIIYLLKKKLTNKAKNPSATSYLTLANQELEQLAKLPASSQAISQLSILLKRISLLNFPKKQVASLYGDNWIKFLNQQSDNAFSEQQATALTQLAYQKDPAIDPQLWQSLIVTSRQLIQQLLVTNTANTTHGTVKNV